MADERRNTEKETIRSGMQISDSRREQLAAEGAEPARKLSSNGKRKIEEAHVRAQQHQRQSVEQGRSGRETARVGRKKRVRLSKRRLTKAGTRKTDWKDSGRSWKRSSMNSNFFLRSERESMQEYVGDHRVAQDAAVPAT